MSRSPKRRRMIPSYLATRGVGTPTRNTLHSLMAVVATGLPPASHHTPVQQRIISLLTGGALTVSETAAYLRLQTGVCKVLLSQLLDGGHLQVRVPAPYGLQPDPNADRPSKELLEEVLNGLRALKQH
ncbi:DUF742 domain-containing protein [Kitasatospora paracochleata]|uniref:DUF742 domain-containing protein n=1 Tax=Kitasatospora paracochleata TaxID=58354 RepID=A0ABT1IWQ8_9ACTN|nr:DUF742 domain-containing protein [Kitasatospora paracochleata]MCP2309579.1 hypothetical protein [Kitasatospora paracochleata]